jgi:hypothetical protein
MIKANKQLKPIRGTLLAGAAAKSTEVKTEAEADADMDAVPVWLPEIVPDAPLEALPVAFGFSVDV